MKKIIVYLIAFFFLISAYIFGSIALYYFLCPYWGEALAALSLCLLAFLISLSLTIMVRFSKSKKKRPYDQILPLLEKNLDHLPKSQDLLKALTKASPAVLVTVLGVTAVATYIMFFKKRDK